MRLFGLLLNGILFVIPHGGTTGSRSSKQQVPPPLPTIMMMMTTAAAAAAAEAEASNDTWSTSNGTGTMIPHTPCVRICRYNQNIYNGNVCIGCYREVFEIANWDRMTNMEKSVTLLDAADRCNRDEDDTTLLIKEELLRQAKVWGQQQ